MSPRRRRLIGLVLLLLGFAIATALVLLALRDNISYFRTPTELVSGNYPEHNSKRGVRLGGMVEKDSVQRQGDKITFRATDFTNSLTVRYQGIVPDLFREGQGVVAEGHVNEAGEFIADRLLAKHDEKYVPPEIKRVMKP